MIPEQLSKLFYEKKFSEFTSALSEHLPKLTEKDKQELLVSMIEQFDVWDNRLFPKLIPAFDKIIDTKVNLNFNIDHWAPTFLSLVIHWLATKESFDYFVRKGADINFVGDDLAFATPKEIAEEEKFGFERYSTCLDFALLKRDDICLLHESYLPENLVEDSWKSYDNYEKIAVGKADYVLLYDRAKTLNIFVGTDNLIDHIRRIGGKEYEELKGTTKDKS